MNYQELQQQLYSLLTEEERKKGVYVQYDPLSSTLVFIGEDDIEYIFRRSPYRDHIVGFKRGQNSIELILDEEGQKKWEAKEEDIRKFYGIWLWKQIAIIGHKERGSEVIKLLKGFGGKDQPIPCDGSNPCFAYYIKNGYIVDSYFYEVGKFYTTLEELDVLRNIFKEMDEWLWNFG